MYINYASLDKWILEWMDSDHLLHGSIVPCHTLDYSITVWFPRISFKWFLTILGAGIL